MRAHTGNRTQTLWKGGKTPTSHPTHGRIGLKELSSCVTHWAILEDFLEKGRNQKIFCVVTISGLSADNWVQSWKEKGKTWGTICLGGFKRPFSLPTWKNVRFSTSWTIHTDLSAAFRKNFPMVTALREKENARGVCVKTTPIRRENNPGAVDSIYSLADTVVLLTHWERGKCIRKKRVFSLER